MASNSEVALANLGSSRSSGYEEDGQQTAHSRQSQDVDTEHEQATLAPVDGGTQAWLFLVGCFFIEALVWGKFVFFLFLSRYNTITTLNVFVANGYR